MNKIYFISSAYKGCSYVRCLLPTLHGGYNGSVTSLYSDLKDHKTILLELMSSDLIIFHRPQSIDAHKVAIELKRQGKKIIFDNDDTFKLEKGNPFYTKKVYGKYCNVEKHSRLMDNFIRSADAALTTTEFLAKEYRKINKQVFVLPNCVDKDDWSEPKRNEEEKIRIALVGSVTYSKDFEHIKDIIKKLDKRDDIQFVIFGLDDKKHRGKNKLVEKIYKDEYKFWDNLKNLEHVPWSKMEDYFDTLNELRLDIMLIPRAENYFNKCKSNIKFLEASMCEIPVIAQGFTDDNSPYDKDINGKNGILIKDNSKWEEEIERLIKDKKLRRAIGKEAKRYTLEHYDIKNNVYRWEEAFNQIT